MDRNVPTPYFFLRNEDPRFEFFFSEHKTSVAGIQKENDIFRNQKAFKVGFTNPKKHSMVGFTKRLAIKKKKKKKREEKLSTEERRKDKHYTDFFYFYKKLYIQKKKKFPSCLAMAISRQNFRFQYFTNH
jgi:hypothetical protein